MATASVCSVPFGRVIRVLLSLEDINLCESLRLKRKVASTTRVKIQRTVMVQMIRNSVRLEVACSSGSVEDTPTVVRY